MTQFVDIHDLHATAWSNALPVAAERATSALIEPGAVLVKRGTALPEGVYVSGNVGEWDLLATRSPEFDERVRGSEWTWSYYVPGGVASSWSWDAGNAVQRATRRLVGEAQGVGLNSIEVSSVELGSVLGMKQATVRADLRNLQRGPFLRPLDSRHRVRRTWHPRDLIRTINRKGAEVKAL
jgi:hypothetical protein